MNELQEKKYYIIIDGVDGGGKTTLVAQLAKALDAYTVYEPGGTAALRNLILNGIFTDEQMALLFMADRLIVHESIKYYLQDSSVVSDRGFPSSYIYQGKIINIVSKLHQMFDDKLIKPDRIYILDIPLEAFRERKSEKNLLDRVAEENFEKFRLRYTNLQFPNTFVLDGRLPTSDLVNIILNDLSEIK